MWVCLLEVQSTFSSIREKFAELASITVPLIKKEDRDLDTKTRSMLTASDQSFPYKF